MQFRRPVRSFERLSRRLALCLLVAATAASEAATVNSSADANPPGTTCVTGTCTLRQAIAEAAPGDTIDFAPGISTITLTSGELPINKSLTISGPGANLLTVQRSTVINHPRFGIFAIGTGNIDVTIAGLTIDNGASSHGGGIRSGSSGTLTVAHAVLKRHRAYPTAAGVAGEGGGIYSSAGRLVITNSVISQNVAERDGGGVFFAGDTFNAVHTTFRPTRRGATPAAFTTRER